jgi:hypothetical protein
MQLVAQSGQTICFCRVNAHFQNRIAEKHIHKLSKQACKQLLHAKARWPEAIEINLWPYAIHNANDIHNTIADKEDGGSHLEQFCHTDICLKLQHNHTFSCPVYALQDQLQGWKAMPKWNKQAWLGINLGPLPQHASLVNLVLKLDTGLVLLQFHVQFDDSFETVRPCTVNKCTFSQWQFISGLVNRWTKDRGQDPQGATMKDETGPMILPSQSQPDELNTGQQHQCQTSLMQLSLQQMTHEWSARCLSLWMSLKTYTTNARESWATRCHIFGIL